MKQWIISLRRLARLSAGMLHSPLDGPALAALPLPCRCSVEAAFDGGKSVLACNLLYVVATRTVSSSTYLSFTEFPVVGCGKPVAKWFTAQGK